MLTHPVGFNSTQGLGKSKLAPVCRSNRSSLEYTYGVCPS